MLIKIMLIILLVPMSWILKAQLRPFYSASVNKYGFMNENGKIIIAPQYDFAWNFTDGMSSVKIAGKYGYISQSGNKLIPLTYDGARAFSDGLAVVKIGHKYGFIDKGGKLVVPAIYDRADNYHGDCANVCLNRKWNILIYPVNTHK